MIIILYRISNSNAATESDPPSLHPSAAALPTRRVYSSSTHSTAPGYTFTICGPDPGV